MPQNMMFPVHRAGATGKIQPKELEMVLPVEFATVLPKTVVV